MANIAQIVKWETSSGIARLRLWVDDEAGHHLTVCDLEIPWPRLLVMAIETERVRDLEAQLTLFE